MYFTLNCVQLKTIIGKYLLLLNKRNTCQTIKIGANHLVLQGLGELYVAHFSKHTCDLKQNGTHFLHSS